MPDEPTKLLFYSENDFKREFEITPNQDEYQYRSPFRRDYGRLLHSPTFRRLKGKTQLFPGIESDFYRNRLTHSLEVAQIGKSIANYINYQLEKIYQSNDNLNINLSEKYAYIDLDLVEFSCLAHDIGHPPFGHQGEEALDEEMRGYGGFEGNAQTLRLLAKLEKKERLEYLPQNITDHIVYRNKIDVRVGLNLCYRSLASILKYDNRILPDNLGRKKVDKGYYDLEKKLVINIKESILKNRQLNEKQTFKTIECQIMDIADDIAYSIYDLEDAFKGGFFHPLELYSKAYDDKTLLDKILLKIKSKGIKEKKDHLKNITIVKIQEKLTKIFLDQVSLFANAENTDNAKNIRFLNRMSIAIAKDGYYRTEFTSKMAGRFIHSVTIKHLDIETPALSTIEVESETELEIEILKHLTYEYQIISPKLKAVEFKGKRIVREIFRRLTNEHEHGEDYLPEDVRMIYKQATGDNQKRRVICDFIASMTDSYAVEFYSRLLSSTSISIHRPYN